MSIELPGFPASHPPEALRAETEAMSEAWTEVLTQRLGPGLRGIYRKGSAQKRWDTRIDYVPEVSDVDIHVSLVSDADIAKVDSIEAAVEINDAVLTAYRRRIPEPLHVPKPQFVISNQLDALPDIAPSPAETVTTLWGEPYHSRTLTDEERATQRVRSREQLSVHGDFLDALPGRIIDRLGGLAAPLVGEVNWRVSPTAARVLEVLGVRYEEAWSLNRTGLVRALEERGLDELAQAYAAYYLAGWEAFLAGPEGRESGSALPVLRAGTRVVELGAAFAASLEATPAS